MSKLSGDLREAFRIKQSGDGSYIIEPSSKHRDAHISAHPSGDFHVTYERRFLGGTRLRVSLRNGQPFSTFRGCTAIAEQVLTRESHSRLKRFNPSKPVGLVVDMDSSASPLFSVTVFLLDPGNGGLFKAKVARLRNPLDAVIGTCQPNIGFVKHEPIA